jgi:hypothetical protein
VDTPAGSNITDVFHMPGGGLRPSYGRSSIHTPFASRLFFVSTRERKEGVQARPLKSSRHVARRSGTQCLLFCAEHGDESPVKVGMAGVDANRTGPPVCDRQSLFPGRQPKTCLSLRALQSSSDATVLSLQVRLFICHCMRMCVRRTG